MPSSTYNFTPPTCTLEIIGKKSLLWLGKSAERLKKFQFKLKFDDPRQPTAKQVTIQGNQQDLEQLQTAVSRYLKNQLRASFQSKNVITEPIETTRHPYFESQGLTNHELFFGSLSHDSDRQQITLGTVQLFDLVAALEAYQTKISTLTDDRQNKPERKIIPLGVGVAAAAIAAILIATILKPQVQPEIASNKDDKPQAAIPELSEITPPAAPNSDRHTPQLKEPLASTKKLPPPPAVETPKPKPDIPDPADYPLADVGRRTGLDDLAQKNKVDERSPEPTKPQNRADSESIILEKNPIETTVSQVKPEPENQETNPDLGSGSSNESLKPTPNLAIKNVPNQLSQIQEVTAYFRDRWQPPADLKQSLEYRLFLRADGSIERVMPLGKAARLYLSQTNIPINGEQFISPVLEAESSIIRLLLNPDGRVQAFTE